MRISSTGEGSPPESGKRREEGQLSRRGLQLPHPIDLGSALERHFGVAGTLTPVASERDYVYLVECDGRRLVARLSPPDESGGSIRLQNRALEALIHGHQGVRVPAILRSNRGRRIVQLNRQGRPWRLRLLTYVPGIPAARRLRSDKELFAIGTTLAGIDQALSRIRRHRPTFALAWDLESAPRLRTVIGRIQKADHRILLTAALTTFERQALPTFQRLPQQAIHNDFSPNNILYRQPDDILPCGVIDFADVIIAPRVVDLGIAITRFAQPSVLAANASAILAGYQTRSRLASPEIAVVFHIIAARLAMRILVRYYRSDDDARMPAKDVEAIQESLALLEELCRIGPSDFSHSLMASKRG